MSLKFLSTFLFLSLFAFSVSAQENTDETKTTSEQSEGSTEASVPAESSSSSSAGAGVEKIEVTGSHIKRIDVEGPSPVLTLDRDYLDRSGYNSVGDVLRELPTASFGGGRESSLSGGADTGSSTTSLRGFGSGSILVLLNGKRLPTIGGSNSVDLNLIPKAAVERVEILKDGASAIYGSDALGGVINIITKKDMDGGSVELGYTVPEQKGGARADVKAAYGKSGAKYNFLGVFQYRNNQSVFSRDRDFAKVQSLGELSPSGSPGSWRNTNAAWNAGGGSTTCPASQVRADGRCGFDYSTFSQITPQIDQFSGLFSGSYEISESLKVFSNLVYVRRNVKSQLAPAPDAFRDDTAINGPNYQVPTSTATNWGLAGPTGPFDVQYRLVEEAGPRISETNSDSYSAQLGTTGYFFDTWEWEFSGNYGKSDTTNTGVSGFANKAILFSLANSSPTGFNPFAASGSKSDISSAKYQPQLFIESSIGGAELKTFGELLDMPAGPLALALGVAGNWQTYEQSSDAITSSKNQWGGGTDATGKGHRDFQSAYMEFSVPPMTGMEVQLAGRFDNYSDFGSTVNPKVAVKYKPLNMLLLRASWGTGFKAPALDELYEAQTVSFPFGLDPITNSQGQFERIGGGNPNLREETSDTFNVGAVIEPIKRLSFGFDYWKTHLNSSISAGNLRDIFSAEETFGNSYLQGFGIDVQRNPGTNEVIRIIAPNVNLASSEVDGLDLSVSYRPKLWRNLDLNLQVDHSVVFNLIQEPFPGLGKENRVGFYGNPHWRNIATVGLGTGKYDGSLVFRTVGEQNSSFFDPSCCGKTRDHTEMDIRFQFVGAWGGTVLAGVRNVFGTDRPEGVEYLGDGRINTNLYDPFGRAYYMTYIQSF